MLPGHYKQSVGKFRCSKIEHAVRALACVLGELLAEAREVYLSKPSTQLTEVSLHFLQCQVALTTGLQKATGLVFGSGTGKMCFEQSTSPIRDWQNVLFTTNRHQGGRATTSSNMEICKS